MRSRKELVEALLEKRDQERWTSILMEILFDIRDLLADEKKERYLSN